MAPLEGITIGDMGEKVGSWNGVENGWIKFDNHRFSLEALLNRTASVQSDGTYRSAFKDDKEQQLSNLAILSIGRAAVVGKGAVAVRLATVIATRYSAVRKQFQARQGEELSIIEYPMQQHRIFPHIATAVALSIFYRKFILICYKHFIRCAEERRNPNELVLSQEIHALSCAAKVISTEAGVSALDEARLACGAYGYLKSSRLNDLRDAFEPSRTYEGDNNILTQQVTYTLISASEDSSRIWKDSPLGSLAFLDSKPEKFSVWKDDILEDIVKAYIWLLHFLLSTIKVEIEGKCRLGLSRREARLIAQSEQYRVLANAYGELVILNWFRESLLAAPKVIRKILRRLATVYAYSSIDKHIATLYIGGYCTDSQWGATIKRRLREAEAALLPDAVSVCDALASPDFVLHSILGSSDGQIYRRLLQYFMEFSVKSVK